MVSHTVYDITLDTLNKFIETIDIMKYSCFRIKYFVTIIFYNIKRFPSSNVN